MKKENSKPRMFIRKDRRADVYRPVKKSEWKRLYRNLDKIMAQLSEAMNRTDE